MFERDLLVNPRKFSEFLKVVNPELSTEEIDKLYAVFYSEKIITSDGSLDLTNVDRTRIEHFYKNCYIVSGTETKMKKELTKISLKQMYENSRDVFYEFVSDMIDDRNLRRLITELGVTVKEGNKYDIIVYLVKNKHLGTNVDDIVETLAEYLDSEYLFNELVLDEFSAAWDVCKVPSGKWGLVFVL